MKRRWLLAVGSLILAFGLILTPVLFNLPWLQSSSRAA
jgi:hypothetical protein